MRETLIALLGVLTGVATESVAYFIKKRGYDMQELIDSLIEELEKLEVMYTLKHPSDPDDPETRICLASVKHKFARLIRRRHFFWHRATNRNLIFCYENFLNADGGTKPFEYTHGKFVDIPDSRKTCCMKADKLAVLIRMLERIHPVF